MLASNKLTMVGLHQMVKHIIGICHTTFQLINESCKRHKFPDHVSECIPGPGLVKLGRWFALASSDGVLDDPVEAVRVHLLVLAEFAGDGLVSLPPVVGANARHSQGLGVVEALKGLPDHFAIVALSLSLGLLKEGRVDVEGGDAYLALVWVKL